MPDHNEIRPDFVGHVDDASHRITRSQQRRMSEAQTGQACGALVEDLLKVLGSIERNESHAGVGRDRRMSCSIDDCEKDDLRFTLLRQ